MYENSWQSTQLAESAIDAPSLSAGYGDRVWLGWAGTDGNGTLNVASGFRPGSESGYDKTTLDGMQEHSFNRKCPLLSTDPIPAPAGPSLRSTTSVSRWRTQAATSTSTSSPLSPDLSTVTSATTPVTSASQSAAVRAAADSLGAVLTAASR